MSALRGWIRTTVVVVAIVGCSAILSSAADRPGFGEPPALTKLQNSEVTGEEVFRRLVEHNRQRDFELRGYSVERTYEASNQEGKVYAQTVVDVDYIAPDKKTFLTKSEEGSWMVRRMVLDRLIDSEKKAASGTDHRDSSISPRNYSFNLLGEDQVGPYACYVVEAAPRRQDKYLFEGWIWISKDDFGIVRIAGHPAKNPSFWLERVDFLRQYQKIGPFWLPQRDKTIAKIRWKGTKVLTIDHADYTVNGENRSSDVRKGLHKGGNSGVDESTLTTSAPASPGEL